MIRPNTAGAPKVPLNNFRYVQHPTDSIICRAVGSTRAPHHPAISLGFIIGRVLMAHVTNRSWTEADIARLKQLSAAGATVARAAAALNRKTTAVMKVAKRHGIQLIGTRQAKATVRALANAQY